MLKSNILLISTSHRLRSFTAWNYKWNGDDTTLIIPTITSLWYLVLQKQYLNTIFWEHLQSLSIQNKEKILALFNKNVDNPFEGNNKIILIMCKVARCCESCGNCL